MFFRFFCWVDQNSCYLLLLGSDHSWNWNKMEMSRISAGRNRLSNHVVLKESEELLASYFVFLNTFD